MKDHLNSRAAEICGRVAAQAADFRVTVDATPSGVRIIDMGVHAAGGLLAGRFLAEICTAGLADIRLASSRNSAGVGVEVQVMTDHCLLACIGAQYAGWAVQGEKYFAMGSGPMRMLRGREEVLERYSLAATENIGVGVLEASARPPEEVAIQMAADCRVAPENLTLVIAPTASQAGAVQIVARSLETALHKMEELDFDLTTVVSGSGRAPLPPASATDLEGIGRTNDSILYGGEVTLWIDGDDDLLADVGPKIPSSASSDHGAPFAEIFARYDGDFYKIDPLLFSPAKVNLANVRSGRLFSFGETRPDLLEKSFQ